MLHFVFESAGQPELPKLIYTIYAKKMKLEPVQSVALTERGSEAKCEVHENKKGVSGALQIHSMLSAQQSAQPVATGEASLLSIATIQQQR